jgi:hypothetical protein
MEKGYLFPKKCCVCLSEHCSTVHKLIESTSNKVGLNTIITSYSCSVPVCEKCQDKFGRINYGWLTWFAIVLFGGIVGALIPWKKGSVGGGMVLTAVLAGIIGLFPSIFVSIKYGHKTEPPVYLSKVDGRPCFSKKEYQQLFDELNPK